MTSVPEDPNCDVAHGKAEPAGDQRLLVAVFASPVAGFLLRYAADAGFRTILVEPDPELAKTAGADHAVTEPAVRGYPGESADIVVTDHHRAELGVALRDALGTEARWIGIMGNPRHRGPHIEALTALGVPAGQIARVHRPIGLNIGSRAPAEIAIATLAGLIADRNDRPGGFAF